MSLFSETETAVISTLIAATEPLTVIQIADRAGGVHHGTVGVLLRSLRERGHAVTHGRPGQHQLTDDGRAWLKGLISDA